MVNGVRMNNGTYRLGPNQPVALENVTNQRYRFHGSDFYRPGTSLIVGYSRGF